MELSWKEMAKLYAPVIVLFIVNVLGVVYAAGHEAGKRAMLDAGAASAREARTGALA